MGDVRIVTGVFRDRGHRATGFKLRLGEGECRLSAPGQHNLHGVGKVPGVQRDEGAGRSGAGACPGRPARPQPGGLQLGLAATWAQRIPALSREIVSSGHWWSQRGSPSR